MAVTLQSTVLQQPQVRARQLTEDPLFFQSVAATTNYYVDPVIRAGEEAIRFRGEPMGLDRAMEFVPREWRHMPSAFAMATSEEHVAFIVDGLQRSQRRRDVLGSTGIVQSLAAELFNPINYFALPLAGPSFLARQGLMRTALIAGASTATEEAVASGLVQAFDPLQTPEETALNIAGAGVLGGALGFAGGGVSRGMTQRARSQFNAHAANMAIAGQTLRNVSSESLAQYRPREERAIGQVSDDELAQNHDAIFGQIEAARGELAGIPASSGERRTVQDRIDQLEAQLQPLNDELSFRRVEAMGLDMTDPYRPARGGESPLLRWVSTPMRRALSSNAPTAVKDMFVRLAGDSSVHLQLNAMGQETPLSVHQYSAVEFGQAAAFHADMQELYSLGTGASRPGIAQQMFEVNASSAARRLSRTGNDYDSWLIEVSRKRTMGIEDLTDIESQAVQRINRYFEQRQAELESVGLLQTAKNASRRLESLLVRIQDLEGRLRAAEEAGRADEALSLRNQLDAANARRMQYEAEAQGFASAQQPEPFLPRYWVKEAIIRRREEFTGIIENWFTENPYVFSFNEKTKAWERVELASDPDSIRRRAEQTVENILGERDPFDPDNISYGYGRSRSAQHRRLDIPNRLVWDFIEQNPLNIIKAYTARTMPRYHFERQFGGNIQKVLSRMQDDMRKAGRSPEEINRIRRDFVDLYDQVVGTSIKDPSTLSQRVAHVLRSLTSLSYLGGAGLSAIPDFAKIVMNNELENVMRGVQSFFDSTSLKMSMRETRLAGSALDLFMGSAGARMVEDLTANFARSGVLDRTMDAFYRLNLLGPITGMAKYLDGMITGHAIIDYSRRVVDGTATEKQVQYLLRHGLSTEDAAAIARAPWQTNKDGLYLPNTDAWLGAYHIPEIAEGRVNVVESLEDGSSVGKFKEDGTYKPAFYRREEGDSGTIYFDREYIEGEMFDRKAWTQPTMEGVEPLPEGAFKTPQEWSNFVMWHEIMHTRHSAEDLGLEPRSAAYENRINEMAMEAHQSSVQVQADTVLRFRAALNSSILNTIISATPADKPIINRGVVYIPSHIGERFGLSENRMTPGYSRIENGFLGLPFQFYNYLLASVNKTTGLMLQGQVMNRGIGIMAMLGAGYITAKLKTNQQHWEDMNLQDRAGKAIDMSGVIPLYSDLFYTALHQSLALGGPNITGGFISPRYRQDESMVDAITNVTGAATGWTASMLESMAMFARGEYGPGARQAILNMPGSTLWFLRNDLREVTAPWRY